jgi:hypothetical protein
VMNNTGVKQFEPTTVYASVNLLAHQQSTLT